MSASPVAVTNAMPGVNLLWTGGWDSTFQLLRLLLVHRVPVTPYYLKDPTRPSTAIELDTMQRIRERLRAEHPHTAELLLPTRVSSVEELDAPQDIADAFDALRTRSFMGSQYVWLARFCRQHAITDMELCIHRDDKAHAAVESFVRPQQAAGGYPTWRIDQKYAGTDAYTLFGAFSFPVFEISKLEMDEEARQRGWQPLMGMTWFCHRPRKDAQPCGHCNPCLYTIEEGLGWRIPRSQRMTSVAYRLLVRPLKAPARTLLKRLRSNR